MWDSSHRVIGHGGVRDYILDRRTRVADFEKEIIVSTSII